MAGGKHELAAATDPLMDSQLENQSRPSHQKAFACQDNEGHFQIPSATEASKEPRSSKLGELATSTLYKPLEKSGTKIRVLSILPASEDQSSLLPISCSLEEVDLEDWTPEYQSFRDGLPIMDDENYRLIQGRTRHVLWGVNNYALREGRGMAQAFTPEAVKRRIALHIYCDKPLESSTFSGNRYNWGDYIALSYVWGDQTHKKDIILNGSRFQVGLNLHTALLRLRNSSEIKSLKLKIWIDAICINQDDLDERATEVKKMAVIYSEALAVRAWLGRPSVEVGPEVPIAKSLLDAAFILRDKSIRGTNISDMDHKTQRQCFEMAQGFLEELGQGEDEAYSLWAFAEDIFKKPYWKRLWIVQEVALASSLLFWFGDYDLTTTELRAINARGLWEMGGPFRRMERFLGEGRLLSSLLNMQNALERILSLRWDEGGSRHKGRKPIVESITQARVSDATDSRDKVYGILATLPSTVSSCIRPNYDPGFSWQDCWTMFARSCFQGEGNLNLLARSAGHSSTEVGIPTWAFSLSDPRSRRILSSMDTAELPDFSDAHTGFEDLGAVPRHVAHTFESSIGLEGNHSFSNEGRLLSCQGVLVDTVGAITAFRYPAETKVEPAQYSEASQMESPVRLNIADARMSLVRVLQEDSKSQFTDNPSVLDMPWFSADQLARIDMKPRDLVLDENILAEVDESGVMDDQDQPADKRTRWETCFQDMLVRDLFSRVFHVNETFEFHGVRLRDYFVSGDAYCKNWPQFRDTAVLNTMARIMWRRLFRTQKGLIGSITRRAMPGDRIAIIYKCDMPVVLRPRGNTYEVIGGCFVDGLMNGEAVEDIKSGNLATETFCLC